MTSWTSATRPSASSRASSPPPATPRRWPPRRRRTWRLQRPAAAAATAAVALRRGRRGGCLSGRTAWCQAQVCGGARAPLCAPSRPAALQGAPAPSSSLQERCLPHGPAARTRSIHPSAPSHLPPPACAAAARPPRRRRGAARCRAAAARVGQPGAHPGRHRRGAAGAPLSCVREPSALTQAAAPFAAAPTALAGSPPGPPAPWACLPPQDPPRCDWQSC